MYSYVNNTRGQSTTTTALSREIINGTTYKYVYDALGNITEIQNGSGNALYRYVYDGMSQLISDTDFVNNKKHVYEYDNAGNILSETTSDIDQNGVESNPVTINYSYGDSNWTDKLTAYSGQAITYDAIGNPLAYRDGMTMTWKNGRQLATLQDSNNTISYSYDSNSVRVKKNVNGTEYTYAYVNGLLMYETRGTARFFYSYDSNGILYSVKYTLTDSSSPLTYYYTHNSRGDIVGIYNEAGELMAHYEYDAWGNVLSVTDQNGNAITSATHIGNLNPFRYRGYYLDTETGLYYLMSRYYDPVVHRFINSDGYFQSGGNILDANMSAYCGNNPVMFFDLFGERYISSTTVRNEDKNERFISCRYQSFASLKKYNPAPIGTYSGGDIYFVSSEDRNPTTWNTDVVIRDFRNSEHNVRIINSCLITNPEDMYTILNCLSEYEKQNPSKWERDSDVDDMYTEWDAHNWSFKYIGCFNSAVCKRAQSVDIDNKDANKSFWDHTFGRFLNERFG